MLNIDHKTYEWAVVGAGPAGIAAVGKLIDHGVRSSEVLWIDPYFTVGDLGRLWCNVSSNTTVKRFLDFLHACPSFAYQAAPIDFELNHLQKDGTCLLRQVVEPLQWVTHQLIQQVPIQKKFIHALTLRGGIWTIQSEQESYHAKNTILATGAVPLQLNYPEIPTIPFEEAIDKERLREQVNLNETYAVFGSSHSAIMIIHSLVDLGVKRIINFYRSPCRYAVDLGEWILFDNTGLKGHTAAWARAHIDGTWPNNLTRYKSTESNITKYLPTCDKAIHAVGFKQRDTINLGDFEHTDYSPHVGIIGPGLFGLGIAYPEKKSDPFGGVEMQVGMWKFMTYLDKIIPIWFKYHT